MTEERERKERERKGKESKEIDKPMLNCLVCCDKFKVYYFLLMDIGDCDC